ncbi:hypothetical protein ACI2OX_11095 [Bacillus sp. N9]
MIERVIRVVNEQIKGQTTALQKELKVVTKATNAVKLIAELELFYENKQTMITEQTGNEEERLNELLDEWKRAEKNVRLYSESVHKKSAEEREKQLTVKQEQEIQIETISINDVIKKLDHAVSYLRHEKSFDRMTAQLMQRAKRLKEKIIRLLYLVRLAQEIFVCQCVVRRKCFACFSESNDSSD